MRRIAQALLLLLAACGVGSIAEAACSAITIAVNEGTLAPGDRSRLANDLRTAVNKVCAWWGGTFAGRLMIDLSPTPGPSMALVPAWRGERGQMLFREPAVRDRRAATVHEVVHVFAPNANRFLAEGLAVYAHEHLRGPAAYPNFGRSLHDAARAHAPRAEMSALDRLATPAMLQGGGLAGREAYLVAGSFVRFLIERHGLTKFRRLYALTPLVPGQRDAGSAGRWQHIYGAPLDRLAAEWRQRVGATR
jgi:hypothetical protein